MNITKAAVPSIVLSGLLLAGCVSNPAVDEPTAGTTVQSDSQRTKTEAAVLGGLLGGLIGLATGDEKGAAIGAVLGAGAGYVIGSEVAKRKEKYASDEEFLDAEIARTAEFNETARAQHGRLRKEIAALDRETLELQAQYRQGNATRAQLSEKKRDLDARLAKNREFEGVLEKEYELNAEILAAERQSRPQDDPYLSRLEKENDELRMQIEQLREGSNQLAEINERLSV
jgi:chromosome segregation ATPase